MAFKGLFGGGTPPTVIVQTTDSVGPGPRVTIGAGETVFVELAGVRVVSTDLADAIIASDPASLLSVQNDGTIVGANAITANGNLALANGATGLIVGDVGVGIFATDDSDIVNFGTIRGVNGAADLAGGSFANYGTMGGTVAWSGQANVANFGTMSGNVQLGAGTSGNRFFNGGTIGGFLISNPASGASADTYHNAGTLGGATVGGTNGLLFFNTGSILGPVTLAGDVFIFDSTLGKVFNQIDATQATGTIIVVGGLIGGVIKGGTSNDIFYANPTQASADNGNNFQLYSGKGTNALYGGGAFTVFHVGTDAAPGETVFNQVWGGLSKMVGVLGYANNTISFDTAAAGVYVDLLNGHNAYATLTAGADWGTGAFALQDSIQHVPNVVGSAFGDLLIADNGIARLTGGGKADQLYAGTGPGSQDTFIYTGYADSNLVTGYDTVVGYKLGVDRIDLSALHTDFAHLVIATSGTTNSVYVEKTPGTFNAATDLAIQVNTTTTGGLQASDFIF